MGFRQMRSFLSIAETLHFGRTAEDRWQLGSGRNLFRDRKKPLPGKYDVNPTAANRRMTSAEGTTLVCTISGRVKHIGLWMTSTAWVMEEWKQCSKCGVEYSPPEDFFQKNPTGKGGLRPDCKWCHNSKARAWKVTDRGRELNRLWTRSHRSEKAKQQTES